ncbi:nucleotidyltransferase [Tenacibaculum sp. SSH1-16]|uniref:nucleotidyltransferase n=1 Tax=Tenacibaculum sp. SSH1-16 TaxID=3136667 RepID=UPI0032C46115
MNDVQDIKNEMIAVKNNESALQDLNSSSKVSVWNLLFYIVAVCGIDLRKMHREHRTYVDYRLDNQKSGTLPWYRSKALEFQYGFDLIPGTDKYINGEATEEQIEASKIIKYATASNGATRGSIVIKVATEKEGKLSPIEPGEQNALEEYFEEVKWAGREITIINHLADKLYLNLRIYRDPLILDVNGISILDGNKPVEDALQEFMKELPFNGELVLQSLVDKLQLVRGVKIAHIIEVKSSSLDPANDAYGTPQYIEVSKIPASGYFEIVDFNNVNYVV